MTDAPTLSRQPVKAEEPAKRWRNIWRLVEDAYVEGRRAKGGSLFAGTETYPSHVGRIEGLLEDLKAAKS